MDFKAFSRSFAEKIGGEYNEYDDKHSIFVVPLRGNRFQTVVAKIIHREKYGRDTVQVTSKVCSINENINYPVVLEASKDFVYTNFIVSDGFLQIDTSFFIETTSQEIIEEMIREVAFKADEWELKITGEDIF